MCVISAPSPPPMPEMPAEKQASKAPDGTQTGSAARRATDRVRGATSTILTSGSGVTDAAATGKKTLLGG